MTPTFCKTIVAIYHNCVSIIKRSAGKSSIAAAAYRSGEKMTDERTGLIHDYTRRSGVDYSVILTPLKADWITDRQQLWNRVEEVEKRGDSQLAREITLAIPCELSRYNQIQLVCEYVQTNFVNMGMVADINFHKLDSDNPHVHLMLSLRDLKIDERGDVFFAGKNRDWNHKNLLIKNRQSWAEITNKYLIQAGFSYRQIDHRSNADRGIEALPQIHLGAAAAGMRNRGIASERGDEYDQILIANHNIRSVLKQIFESESATRNLENELAEFDRQASKREQFYEKIEKPREVAKPPKPSTPAHEKWSLKREIDPQLVSAIVATADRLGTEYTAGNYQIQIRAPQREIEIRYMNNLAMIVDIGTNRALPIDYSFTFQQYEQGLKRSIDVLTTDLEQQRQTESEQLERSELPLQAAPELHYYQDIIIDDPEISDDAERIIIDAPTIETKPSINQNLSRKTRSEWNR